MDHLQPSTNADKLSDMNLGTVSDEVPQPSQVALPGVPVASVQGTTIRGSTVKIVGENEGILLANPQVPKFVSPTCLLWRLRNMEDPK